MKGIKVNRNELANIFGVSTNTISTWSNKGCPFVQKPDLSRNSPPHKRVWIFDTAEVIHWRISKAVNDQNGWWDLKL